MNPLLFLIGIALSAAGILLIVYNRRISLAYAKAFGKALQNKDFESKGVSIYLRLQFYLAAAILLGFGVVHILTSV